MFDISKNNDLPKGWILTKIEENLEIVTGNTPSTKEKQNYGNYIPFIKPPDLQNKVLSSASDFLSKDGCKKARIVPPNSVFVSCIGNLGKIGINTKPVAFNQQINAIKPCYFIDPKFLFYQAQSFYFREQLENLASATTVTIVNKGKFGKIYIKIPPLNEQCRIVAKIEELFSELDQGIESLKKAKEQLKIYRQAVLKSAFDDHLIKLAKKYKFEKIKNIAIKVGSGSTPKGGENSYQKSGIPLIRSMNIYTNFFKYESLAFINEDQAQKLNNVIVEKGDILLNITGASIGRVTLAPDNMHYARVNQHVCIIRTNHNFVNSKFLQLYLASPKIQHKINQENTGATRQALTKQQILNFEFPIISLKEQQLIIEFIESRFSMCDTLETSINESLQKAEALRQSILKQAFEGKLVPQDPNDEPAEKLLEKIKQTTIKKS